MTTGQAHISPVQERLAITFGKHGALKYTGNLDVAKVWERVLRRADLPIMYSRGFNTRPRIQLATALPMGVTSDCELLDVALRQRLTADNEAVDGIIAALPERLMAVSPAGLTVSAVRLLPVSAPPLQTLIRSAEYRVRFIDPIDPDLLGQRVHDLLAQERIVKVTERKGRKSAADIRPLVYALTVNDAGDLLAHLATGERGNLRPDEILERLDLTAHHTHVHRYALHLDAYDDHTRLRDYEREP